MRAIVATVFACGVVVGCGSSDDGGANADSGSTSGDSSTSDSIVGDAPHDASSEASSDAPKTDAPSDGGGACGSIDSFIPDWVKSAKPTKEIYVSPSGDDGNDGSKDHPYKTSGKAFGAKGPGER